MRVQAEALYDDLAPAYWVTFGLYANTTHRQFVDKFLGRLAPHSQPGPNCLCPRKKCVSMV